ncbi:MAG: Asp23/Gls24 family envelope stress response protein [Acetobacter sp.]|nr:Asp23/Gls24 family envelope stress response protein [Bacteroides sp.]MCM1340593.1 Asp23/Gls24 family envelope stress response protein [Acetobacter sp.]MCM1433333.1 Asp23/Gls24 family envelope stress response protein [Clostridiales bacterium]
MEISLKSSMGELIISDEVVSSIAVNAAKDVDGVSSFHSGPVDVVSTIKQGSLKVMSPVRLIQDGDIFSISIYINLKPGVNFQTVATEVQSVVKDAVQNMTGKLVNKVNVIVAGIDFNESEDSEEPCESEE